MLSKDDGNAWNSKKKSLGDDRRSVLASWSKSRKQEGLTNGEEAESWPKLGYARFRKNSAGNQRLGAISQVGSSSGNNIPWTSLTKPGILKERQEAPNVSRSNDCRSSPADLKPGVAIPHSNQLDRKTSFENSEELNLTSKEEKILAFKKLNKERKEERRAETRRKKEDDALRRILGPKGLKVTVIDDTVFSKFCDKGDDRRGPQQTVFNVTGVQELDSTAFPELESNSGKLGVKRYALHSKMTLNSVPVGDNENTKLSAQEYNNRALDAKSPRSTKLKKRRDPVMVDIWEAIEVCKSSKKTSGDDDESFRVSKHKDDKSRISGNILDASNPSRHRGKKREIPSKRNLTRLKKAIMAERKRRREAKNCDWKSEPVGNAVASEAKLFNFSAENHVLVPGVNDLCSSVEVAEGCKLLGVAKEQPDEDRGKSYEEDLRLLQPSSDAAIAVDVDKMAKVSLHSRSFREYCNHSKSSDLSEYVKVMLKDILKFQDRLYAAQPIKAESHRRYVVGLRQTQHLLAVHKVKIVILAQDIEKVPSPGGLDDAVNSIIDSANEQCVPVLFPLTRRQLGKVTYRKVGVSCVGVLNYQGAEENFKKVISVLEDSRNDYMEKFENEKCRIMNDLGISSTKVVEDCVRIKEEVYSGPIQCAVTLPLFQKLTEALSELSIGSTSQITVKEEELSDN